MSASPSSATVSSVSQPATSGATTPEPADGEPDKPPPIKAPPLQEREALELIRLALTQAGQSPDLSDDCARLTWLGEGGSPSALTLTTDALVEGVHFDLSLDTPAQVGAQAAVVNLSDLASSGAWPIGLLWSLSLPSHISAPQLSELSRGFVEVCARYNAPLLGGNLCHREGPLELHVTALGRPLRADLKVSRSGAQVGDKLYVSGALGERALGYLSPSAQTRALRHAWRPHLEEARELVRWGGVSAMMDLSDGLLLDAARLAEASGVTLSINSSQLPLCQAPLEPPPSRALLLKAALSGGEDYLLLFTASEPPPEALGCVEIGCCVERVERVERVESVERVERVERVQSKSSSSAAPNAQPRWLLLDGEPVEPQGFLHGLTPLGAPPLGATPYPSPSLQ